MLRLLRGFRASQEGVTMIEYALIAALVSIIAVSLLSAMGVKLKNLFTNVNSALTTA